MCADMVAGRVSRDFARDALIDNGMTFEGAEFMLDNAQRQHDRARSF